MKPQILLTFDLEEFDLPLEFECPITGEDQINITNNGLLRIIRLFSGYNIPATFFTTSFYADKNKKLIKDLSENHEIASHAKYHSQFTEDDLIVSKNELESITGSQIKGFRMPKFKKIDLSLVKAAGYEYDSSINPTFIPGRYNNFFAKREIYYDAKNNLIEIPASVSPIIRFPLFWLSFKNIPLPVYLHSCKRVLRRDSYLHLYFHPWEFADLESFNIPTYIKRLSGETLLKRFEKLIVELMKTGNFSTISFFLESGSFIKNGSQRKQLA